MVTVRNRFRHHPVVPAQCVNSCRICATLFVRRRLTAFTGPIVCRCIIVQFTSSVSLILPFGRSQKLLDAFPGQLLLFVYNFILLLLGFLLIFQRRCLFASYTQHFVELPSMPALYSRQRMIPAAIINVEQAVVCHPRSDDRCASFPAE